MARQLYNIADIKHCFLSNGGHSVQLLNRFWKCILWSNRMSELFFLTRCLIDKFSPHISAYHLGPCRFMANKIFVKEVRLKVEFLELSQKAFTKMKHFGKCLSMESPVLLTNLTLRAPKSACFWRTSLPGESICLGLQRCRYPEIWSWRCSFWSIYRNTFLHLITLLSNFSKLFSFCGGDSFWPGKFG